MVFFFLYYFLLNLLFNARCLLMKTTRNFGRLYTYNDEKSICCQSYILLRMV
jgi:hypothetical protein